MKLNFWRLALLLFPPLLSMTTAYPQCVEKDLMPEPARDQGFVGNCFSHVAADMIGHRLKQGTDRPQLSPIDVAAQFLRSTVADKDGLIFTNITWGRIFKEEEGFKGSIKDSINGVAQAGSYCNEADMAFSSMGVHENAGFNNKNNNFFLFFRKVKALVKERKASRGKPVGQCPSKDLILLQYTALDPLTLGEDTLKILEKFSDKKIYEFLVDLLCPKEKRMKLDRKQKKSLAVATLGIGDELRKNKSVKEKMNQIFGKIDGELGKDQIVGVKLRLPGNAYHFVSIVGQKAINGTCMFKVRNSHGKNCSSQGQTLFGTKVMCDEDGTFWMSKQELWPFMYDITYFAN